jgi:hypothetical protein
MKKQKVKSTIRKNIQEPFYEWCEEQDINADADALVKYDEMVLGSKLLDHEKAKKEGYYFHLRAQAAAIISSWATTIPLKVNGGSAPAAPVEVTRNVRMQSVYTLPGKGAVRVSKMDEGDLKQLMNIFQIEAENKMARMYEIGKRLERLEETRKQVRETFKQAEEAAYQSVSRK